MIDGIRQVGAIEVVARANRMKCIMQVQLTAIFQKVPEGYIACVEELPDANSQGETQEEARRNLQEAITLLLEANREPAEQELAGMDAVRERIPVAG